MTRFKTLILFLAGILALGPTSPAQAAAHDEPQPSSTPKTPIQHVIFLMQENHTFDNYFGTYPGADGLPPNTRMPIDPNNAQAGYVTPWHIGTSTITDISHNGNAFIEQYNNGRMDGFVSALNRRRQNGRIAMGYYDDRDIPYYWNLADHYVLFDRFFSSARNGSFVNHMYSVAAVPPSSENPLDIAGETDKIVTIFDRLQDAGVSWKFYVQNYDPSINYRNVQGVGARDSQVIWVPLLNFNRFIDDPKLSSRIVDLKEYYKDLQQGTLPAVSYIVPSGKSEHPPQYPGSGQKFVKSLIQELMRSSAWKTSAFIMAYDDWGGFYDHVVPPTVDSSGYGLRVPALLVSPYAREAYVDHTVLDYTSVLKFIEDNWGLAPLAQRDARANNFLGAFDFSQQPRPARFLPLTRENVAPVKQAPTLIIYGAYTVALAVSLVVLVFAFWRRRSERDLVGGNS